MTRTRNMADLLDSGGDIKPGALDNVQFDNINISGNAISSTNTNGNITLAPNGTGEVNLADSDKLTFGAGSDLTITHDGSDSLITDSGTGNLQIRADDFYVMKQDGSEVMIRADTDSFVKLYYDNSEKLATTSTGIDVTGTSKSALVIVDSTGGATPTYSHTNNGEGITLRYNDDSGARAADIVATGNNPAGATTAMRFFVNPASTDAASEVMRIQNDKVAIGTSTAVGKLTTQCTAGDSNFALTAYHPTSTSTRTIAKFQSNVGSTQADKVTILCDGKVGIDNGTPTQLLSVGGASSGTKVIQVTNSTAGTAFNDGMQMFINDSAGGLNMRENYPLQFFVNGSQRMTINSSGNVGINTSSPSGANLEIFTGSTSSDGLKINRFSSGVYYSTLRQDTHGLAIHVGNGSSIAERAAITPNGITFGGDTAAANALDDYEEGTFTPTFSSGLTSPGYSTQVGTYVKVGAQVICSIMLRANSGTENSDHIRIGGLPFAFTSATDHAYGAFFTYNAGFWTSDANVTWLGLAGNTTLAFYQQDTGGSIAGTNSNVAANLNAACRLTAVYRTDS